MEEEIQKNCMIKDTLELELQALRCRLSTVEDFTESMQSDGRNSAVLEDQLSRCIKSGIFSTYCYSPSKSFQVVMLLCFQ